MKILVTGGRTYFDSITLTRILNEYNPDQVVCGGANGADSLAMNWAKANGKICHVYYADWTRYGRQAGPIRNSKMLLLEEPDLVVAFPGGKGTASLIKEAEAGGFDIDRVESVGRQARGLVHLTKGATE